jgi:2-polyprenyl-6-methoxyphenol hydroxylase-like FAD-dependent oxidoreductase
MTHIGIIGAGIAGLHLGLFLQKHGIAATIYTDKTPEQQLGGRLANIVVRSAPTRERERLLGVNHWDNSQNDLTCFSISVGGARPLGFTGNFPQPANIVDMRIYCSRLLEDFAIRGGHIATGTLQTHDVERLAAEHDLMVVATGRGGLTNMFPRLPEHSPYDKPQRLVIGGLYRGIAYRQPLGFEVAITPGQGEILALPLFSFEPHLTGIAFEVVADGAFDVLRHMRYEDDPRHFEATVSGLLQLYAPAIYARIDQQAFALARPLDLCHAAITPTTRRGYAQLADERFAIALGDAHVVIDPLTGQGANNASHAAWVLGEAIRDSQTFDEAFCRRVEQQICAYTLPVAEACNARLRPAPPHAIEMMIAATQHQAIADAFVGGFHHPDRWWEIISSPARSAAFLQQHGWQGMPGAAKAA